MSTRTSIAGPGRRKAYLISGPTSGIGRRTAFELAKYGTVVLIGRDRGRLGEVQTILEKKGGHAISVVCDLSDIVSVRRAAAEIIALELPIAGLLNNAGILQMRPTKSAQGWDMTFATDHLGPFELTEVLMPHLPDGTNVVFVASATEDAQRKPAAAAGFRGGRFISAEASARGEWSPGGAEQPGFDAYATSKQCILAATMALARETPRVHFNAIEPGLTPATNLGRDAPEFVRFLSKLIVPVLVPALMPFMKFLSTPKRAARVITKILINASSQTGVYYDEGGRPMVGSALVRDPTFQDRVVAETRALLSTVAA